MNDRLFRRALMLLALVVPCLVMSQSVRAQEEPPEEDPPYEFFINDYSNIYVDQGANGTILYVNVDASYYTTNPWVEGDPDIQWGAIVIVDNTYVVRTLNVEWGGLEPDDIYKQEIMSRDEDNPSIITGSAQMLLQPGHHTVSVQLYGWGVPAGTVSKTIYYTEEFDVP